MLFTAFGIDLQSMTIIVSVFMFGLGIGGLCGGFLADCLSSHLLILYMAIEFCIALFGFISPWMIERFSNATAGYSEIMTALTSFSILILPTLLMGATFPILVTHVNQYNKNIGRSVGELYFANTLGGVLGAFLAGFLLLNFFDVVRIVNFAALLNVGIALVAFLLFKDWK